jgi:hypothetical protein
MVDFGSGQGRSDFAHRRRSAATPRIAKSENAGLGRKTPFMDGHYLAHFGASIYFPGRPRILFRRWRLSDGEMGWVFAAVGILAGLRWRKGVIGSRPEQHR